MARKSKIEKLPEALRSEIDRLLADPRFTLDELVAKVKDIGGVDVDLSRSALHRRQQDISVVGERIRRSKDIASALVEKFGEADDDQLARLNNQVLQGAIMAMLTEADDDGQPVTLDAKEVKALAQSLNELSRAKKTEADRVLKVRKEAAEKAADAVEDEIKKAAVPGLTADKISILRKAISDRVLGNG
jgi:uncharacterized protein YoxC